MVFGAVVVVIALLVEVMAGKGSARRRSQEEIIVDKEPLCETLAGTILRKRDILFRTDRNLTW